MFGEQYGTGHCAKAIVRSVTTCRFLWAAGLCADFLLCVVFITQSALDYVDRSNGWEIGIGPSIVVVDAGMAKSLTTTTGQADVYAFIFDQKGLMAGVGLQGSKIIKINP